MWAVFAVLSAVFAALTSILAKVGIEGVNSTLATAIRTVVVLAMSWGMVFIMNVQNGIGSISRKSWLFLILSGLAALLLWYLLSINDKTGRSFPFVPYIIEAVKTVVKRGILLEDFSSSMISVVLGFALGFVTAVPVAFLMAWYKPVRYIIEPWIQFIRNIPPLAYVPLVVIAAGVGRAPPDHRYLPGHLPDHHHYRVPGRHQRG